MHKRPHGSATFVNLILLKGYHSGGATATVSSLSESAPLAELSLKQRVNPSKECRATRPANHSARLPARPPGQNTIRRGQAPALARSVHLRVAREGQSAV